MKTFLHFMDTNHANTIVFHISSFVYVSGTAGRGVNLKYTSRVLPSQQEQN